MAWCFTLEAQAEMDASEYETRKALASPAERERVLGDIEAERQAEAQRAAAKLAEEKAAQARIDAARANRPYPERLLESRCGTCHAMDRLSQARHTLPGWHFTIARMRWWNGAPISLTESGVLADYLATRQPAMGFGILIEYAALLSPLALGAGWVWWRLKHKKKT